MADSENPAEVKKLREDTHRGFYPPLFHERCAGHYDGNILNISSLNYIEMETLKKLENIHEPDVRTHAFVKLDFKTGSFSQFTIEDYLRRAESISLHSGVPEDIRSHFETARNLIIYSWFFYPFNMSAQLAAFTTVEFALRIRFNDRETPFKFLLKKAVKDGLIKDEGFTLPVKRAQAIRENNRALPEMLRVPEPTLTSNYSEILSENIPFLRNQLAHGTTELHENGAKHVRISAELINQLFPAPPKKN